MFDRRRLLTAFAALPFAARAELAPIAPRRLLVLDFEMIDTSQEPSDQRADHARRLAFVRDYIAKGLAERKAYDIADRAPIEDEIAGILKQTYFRTCNGCETTLAKKVNADLVLTGTVNKVSTLILSMGVSMARAATGELIYHQGFDFRGDNDNSYARAAKYFVESLSRSPPQ